MGSKPKLTPEQEEQIRKIYKAGLSMKEIARIYNVSPSTVNNIVIMIARPKGRPAKG